MDQKTQDVLALMQKSFAGFAPTEDMKTKANEVMHTTNTGYGAEFIASEVLASQIYDLLPSRSRLLPLLPGSHGSGLHKVYKAPVKKLSQGDLYFSGKSEWTTGDKLTSGDGTKQPTAVTTITQAGFIAKVDLSDEQLRNNSVNTEQYVRDRLLEGMALTVDAVIINGDSETGSSGNVNLDDAAPAALTYYLSIDGGIRERAINSSYTVNMGTGDVTDFSGMIALLGDYAENPDDLLFVGGVASVNKCAGISEFLTVDKYGSDAAVLSGLLKTPFGVDVLRHRAVPKTEADGKVSTTSGNNTKGQILCLYKPAVQYGFGQEMNIELVRVPGYGYQLVVTFEFGFQIVDAAASLSSPTVAAGINLTL